MNRKQWIVLILLLPLSALCFIIIFQATGVRFSQVQQALLQGGVRGLSLILGAMLGQLVIQAFSWMVLLKGQGYQASLGACLSSIFGGWAANFMTPSMYLGGEPVRAYMLTQLVDIPFRKSLGAVIVHKFLEFTSFMMFILACAVIVFMRFGDFLGTRIQMAIIACVFLLALLFLVILLAIIFQRRGFSYLAGGLERIGFCKSFWQKNRANIKEMEDFILAFFHDNLASTLAALGLMALFHGLIFLRPLLFFPLLASQLSMAQLGLIFLLTQLIQALQLTPGGLGILEGGLVGIFSLIHIPVAQTVGYGTFCRIGDFTIVSLGIVLALYHGLNNWMGQERVALE